MPNEIATEMELTEFYRFICQAIALSSQPFDPESDFNSLLLGAKKRFSVEDDVGNKRLNCLYFKTRLQESGVANQLKLLRDRLITLLQSIDENRKNVNLQPLQVQFQFLIESGMFNKKYLQYFITPIVKLLSSISDLKILLDETSILVTLKDMQEASMKGIPLIVPNIKTGTTNDGSFTFKRRKTEENSDVNNTPNTHKQENITSNDDGEESLKAEAKNYRSLSLRYEQNAFEASSAKNYSRAIECNIYAITALKKIHPSQLTEDDSDNIIIFLHQLSDAYFQLALISISENQHYPSENNVTDDKHTLAYLDQAIKAMHDIKNIREYESEEHYNLTQYHSMMGNIYIKINDYKNAYLHFGIAFDYIIKESISNNSRTLDNIKEFEVIENLLLAKTELMNNNNNFEDLKTYNFLALVIDRFKLDQLDIQDSSNADIISYINTIFSNTMSYVLASYKNAMSNDQTELENIFVKLSKTQFGIGTLLGAAFILLHDREFELTPEASRMIDFLLDTFSSTQLSSKNDIALSDIKLKYRSLVQRQIQQQPSLVNSTSSLYNNSNNSPNQSVAKPNDNNTPGTNQSFKKQ